MASGHQSRLASAQAAGSTVTDAQAPAKEPQYDFYTVLPGNEVRLSDAELAASAREEEARRARAEAQRARDALEGRAAAPVPAPVSADTGAPNPDATEAPASSDTAPAQVAATSATTGARYILQAGAFGAAGDAEEVKARIAMLGLGARVESGQANGRTVYRVRMGPYASASELAEAKQKLADSGLPAMAIKAR